MWTERRNPRPTGVPCRYRTNLLLSLIIAAIAILCGGASTLVEPAFASNREVLSSSGSEPDVSQLTAKERSSYIDTFCGPRCAQFVLDHFNKRVDLYELVTEIQDRDWDKGCSLLAIQKALNARGVRTAGITMTRRARLNWPGPAIVHLNPVGKSSAGHFVVQLPSSDRDAAKLWCGLSGIQIATDAQFREIRSGAVLLVSSSEIVHPVDAVVDATAGDAAAVISVISVISVGTAGALMAVAMVLRKRVTRFKLWR